MQTVVFASSSELIFKKRTFLKMGQVENELFNLTENKQIVCLNNSNNTTETF